MDHGYEPLTSGMGWSSKQLNSPSSDIPSNEWLKQRQRQAAWNPTLKNVLPGGSENILSEIQVPILLNDLGGVYFIRDF